jgi:hypothetical protein
MVKGATLKNEVTKPPTIAVNTPIAAGYPEALAIPKLKGNASKKTIKPA